MTQHTQKQRMLAGELYRADDQELERDRAACRAWMARYNVALNTPEAHRLELLREVMAEVGDNAIVRPPFYCDYGYNIRLGQGTFLNFNCVVLDVVQVTIGPGTRIGPAVQIYTADHPRDSALRAGGVEFGRPVVIGSNVWIGGAAIILPGITVGDNAIIGAGSVVTRDVLPGATVHGNPASAARATE